MSGYKLQADLSHWQSVFNASQYPYERVALKATNGASTIDPDYATRVKDAHDHKIAVEHYHFGEIGDGATQAEFFLATIAPWWVAGDRIAYDAEAHGVNARSVSSFAEVTTKKTPDRRGLLYGSPGFLGPAKIRVPKGWGVWIADVTDDPEPEMPAGYPGWVLWQFTFSAAVPGVEGKCDLSRVAPAPAAKRTPLTVVTRGLVKHETKTALRVTRRLAKRVDRPDVAGATLLADLKHANAGLAKQIDRVSKL